MEHNYCPQENRTKFIFLPDYGTNIRFPGNKKWDKREENLHIAKQKYKCRWNA
jgi:hypothetical protein